MIFVEDVVKIEVVVEFISDVFVIFELKFELVSEFVL